MPLSFCIGFGSVPPVWGKHCVKTSTVSMLPGDSNWRFYRYLHYVTCWWLEGFCRALLFRDLFSRAVMAANAAAIKQEVGDPLEQLRAYFDTALSLV